MIFIVDFPISILFLFGDFPHVPRGFLYFSLCFPSFSSGMSCGDSPCFRDLAKKPRRSTTGACCTGFGTSSGSWPPSRRGAVVFFIVLADLKHQLQRLYIYILMYKITSCMYVLYCIVLYCIVLYCIVLYCIVLYCIVLYCIVLYCIVLYCIVLYCMSVCMYVCMSVCIILSKYWWSSGNQTQHAWKSHHL